MKSFVILALCAVLYFELSNGLSLHSLKYRARREATKADTDTDTDPALEEIQANILKGMIELGKNTVTDFTEVFGKVTEAAKENDVKGEDIEKIQILADAGKELLAKGVEDEKSIEKLFEIFGKSVKIATKYQELEDPTDEEKSIKETLDENNSNLIAIKFMTDFVKLRSNLDVEVEAYINGLTEADKEKQKPLIDWYATFKKASGTNNLIDTTVQFFGLFDDDED